MFKRNNFENFKKLTKKKQNNYITRNSNYTKLNAILFKSMELVLNIEKKSKIKLLNKIAYFFFIFFITVKFFF